MNSDPGVSRAVFEQAKKDCASSLYAAPFEGAVNESRYMHTAAGESILNLTKDGFSVYVICFRRADRKVVIEQSQIDESAGRKRTENARRSVDGASMSGVLTGIAYVGIPALLLALSHHH